MSDVSRRLHVVHHADYVAQNAPESRYRWNKNGLVRDLLMQAGDAIAWIEPPVMPLAWIERVHDPLYVAQVVAARVPPEIERRIGFPVTETVARRSIRVPGGTYAAALAAIAHGIAMNSAGGSHHARYETGAGYCVFNDLAVAAVRLIEEQVVRRVLIVDCDVHQGDGTALLTADHADITTYSIHAEKNFPARKARSTLDIPLPDGTGDEAYLAALEASLVPLIDRTAPCLILYQGGVDPYEGDRLGRLALSQDGLDARDRFVAGLARRRDLPLAGTLGGGYGADIMQWRSAMCDRCARSARPITQDEAGRAAVVVPFMHHVPTEMMIERILCAAAFQMPPGDGSAYHSGVTANVVQKPHVAM